MPIPISKPRNQKKQHENNIEQQNDDQYDQKMNLF